MLRPAAGKLVAQDRISQEIRDLGKEIGNLKNSMAKILDQANKGSR
jgi:hypothetical protein